MTMACKLPAGVSTEEGSFGTLGAIALHAVRLAELQIGETVAVIGLGLLGQLVVQILNASGCRTIGFDLDDSKVRLAMAHGMEAGGVVGRDDPKELVLACSGGYGADAALIAAHGKSNEPLLLAADLVRERGRVIALGDRQEPHIAVVFEYGTAAERATPTVTMAARPAAAERVDPLAFGVIGAGRFAQGILLPSLAAQAGVRIAAIATAQGMTAH